MFLSAYLITLNEAKHLDVVLGSLKGVDEIVVVDSGSTDGTQAIALAHGAKVVHQDWLGFPRQKNFAMGLCRGDWVLSMDGDEVLEEGAIAHIRSLIANTKMNGFTIPRYEVFMGRPMMRSRPDPQLRLYRKDKVQWELTRLVHEHLDIEQPVGQIAPYMIHYGNDTIAKAMAKSDKYSGLKAQQKAAAGRRGSIVKLLFSPTGYFFRYMLVRGYWKEGLAGWIYASLQSVYAFLGEAKLIELQRSCRNSQPRS